MPHITAKRLSQFAMIYKIDSFIFVDCKLNVNRKTSKSLLELFGLSQSAFSLVCMSQGVNRAVGKTFSGNNLCDFFYKDLRINISFPLQHGRLYLSFVHTIPDNFCSGTKIIPNRASVRT